MPIRNRAYALIAVCIAGAVAACAAPSDAPPRMVGFVDGKMVSDVKAAIARGDKVIDFGTSAEPPAGWELHSGGLEAAGWEIADALRAGGVKARCVGFCASAMSQAVIASGNCAVTANGILMPHLAFVPDGTREQNKAARLESARSWLEHGFPVDLVDRLEHSPDDTIRIRLEDMKRVGCAVE
jgi:hypothetical protein